MRVRAFSLVEATVVLVLIAGIAGIGTVTFANYLDNQRDTAARNGVTAVLDAQEINWVSRRYLAHTPASAAVVAPMFDHGDAYTEATTSLVSTGGESSGFAAHALRSESGKCVTGVISYLLDPSAVGVRTLNLFTPSDVRPCTAQTAIDEALGAPEAPPNLVAVPSITTVDLTWDAPVSARPIIDYVIEYATAADGPWTVFSDGTGTATAATVTGLTPATDYWFRVAATNAVGTGPWSDPAAATTIDDAPGVVLNLSATLVTSGCTTGPQCIDLAWDSPTTGGTPAGYRVWLVDTGTGTRTLLSDPDLPATPRTYRYDPAAASETFTFEVAGVGASGSLGPAAEASETTAAAPGPPGIEGVEGGEE